MNQAFPEGGGGRREAAGGGKIERGRDVTPDSWNPGRILRIPGQNQKRKRKKRRKRRKRRMKKKNRPLRQPEL